MRIVDLSLDDLQAMRRAAALLIEGFKMHWPSAWPDMDAALDEVQSALGAERISRVAVDDRGDFLGWVGAIKQNDGNVWELHPLVVHPEHQGKGIVRALVTDLEDQVRERGGITLWLGTDDEDSMTTLSDVELYPDVLSI